MANRARDFVARFVTDTSRFNTAPVAQQITKVTQATSAAKTAARQSGGSLGQSLGDGIAEGLRTGDATAAVSGGLRGMLSAVSMAGPIGAAAGIGGALALGMFDAFRAKTKAQEDKVRAAVKTIYDGLLADGEKFVEQWRNSALKDLFDPQNVDGKKLRDAAARVGGAAGSALAQAIQGSPQERAAIVAGLNARIAEINGRKFTAAQSAAQAQSKRDVADLEVIRQGVEDIGREWDTARGAANDYNSAVRDTIGTLNKAAAAQGSWVYAYSTRRGGSS